MHPTRQLVAWSPKSRNPNPGPMTSLKRTNELNFLDLPDPILHEIIKQLDPASRTSLWRTWKRLAQPRFNLRTRLVIDWQQDPEPEVAWLKGAPPVKKLVLVGSQGGSCEELSDFILGAQMEDDAADVFSDVGSLYLKGWNLSLGQDAKALPRLLSQAFPSLAHLHLDSCSGSDKLLLALTSSQLPHDTTAPSSRPLHGTTTSSSHPLHDITAPSSRLLHSTTASSSRLLRQLTHLAIHNAQPEPEPEPGAQTPPICLPPVLSSLTGLTSLSFATPQTTAFDADVSPLSALVNLRQLELAVAEPRLTGLGAIGRACNHLTQLRLACFSQEAAGKVHKGYRYGPWARLSAPGEVVEWPHLVEAHVMVPSDLLLQLGLHTPQTAPSLVRLHLHLIHSSTSSSSTSGDRSAAGTEASAAAALLALANCSALQQPLVLTQPAHTHMVSGTGLVEALEGLVPLADRLEHLVLHPIPLRPSDTAKRLQRALAKLPRLTSITLAAANMGSLAVMRLLLRLSLERQGQQQRYQQGQRQQAQQAARQQLPLAQQAGQQRREQLPLAQQLGQQRRAQLLLAQQSGQQRRSQLPLAQQAGHQRLAQLPLALQTGQQQREQLPLAQQLGQQRRAQLLLAQQSGQQRRAQLPLALQTGQQQREQLPLAQQLRQQRRAQLPLAQQAGQQQREQLPVAQQAGQLQREQLPLAQQLGQQRRAQLPLAQQLGQQRQQAQQAGQQQWVQPPVAQRAAQPQRLQPPVAQQAAQQQQSQQGQQQKSQQKQTQQLTRIIIGIQTQATAGVHDRYAPSAHAMQAWCDGLHAIMGQPRAERTLPKTSSQAASQPAKAARQPARAVPVATSVRGRAMLAAASNTAAAAGRQRDAGKQPASAAAATTGAPAAVGVRRDGGAWLGGVSAAGQAGFQSGAAASAAAAAAAASASATAAAAAAAAAVADATSLAAARGTIAAAPAAPPVHVHFGAWCPASILDHQSLRHDPDYLGLRQLAGQPTGSWASWLAASSSGNAALEGCFRLHECDGGSASDMALGAGGMWWEPHYARLLQLWQGRAWFLSELGGLDGGHLGFDGGHDHDHVAMAAAAAAAAAGVAPDPASPFVVVAASAGESDDDDVGSEGVPDLYDGFDGDDGQDEDENPVRWNGASAGSWCG